MCSIEQHMYIWLQGPFGRYIYTCVQYKIV